MSEEKAETETRTRRGIGTSAVSGSDRDAAVSRGRSDVAGVELVAFGG